MHHRMPRLRITLTAVVLCAAVATGAASIAAASSSRADGGLNVCGLVTAKLLAAAGNPGKCIPSKASTSSTLRIAGAHWGTASSFHYLSVTLEKPLKNTAIVLNIERARILSHGAPVKIGTVASVYTETYNGGHKRGEILVLARGWFGVVSLNNDAAATEAAVGTELVPIAGAVAKKLP